MAIRRNCLIVLALIFQRITEVGISQVRFNVYRLAVCGDCFLELAFVAWHGNAAIDFPPVGSPPRHGGVVIAWSRDLSFGYLKHPPFAA